MKTNKIITLNDDKKYLLVYYSLLFGKNYYLGVEVNDGDVSTSYKVFECVSVDSNYYMKEETDSNIYEILIDKIISNYDVI